MCVTNFRVVCFLLDKLELEITKWRGALYQLLKRPGDSHPEVGKILPSVRLISQAMALGILHPNPLGSLVWNDGYTVTAEKIRSFKTYLTGNNYALISFDAVNVVRVRYGGPDHQKTTRTGGQLSLVVDPSEQKGFLPERIQQTAYGYLVREDYDRETSPSFRYFVKIKEDGDSEAMSGQAVVYDKTFPYPKIDPETIPPPSPAVSARKKTFWFEKVISIVKNTSTHRFTLIIGTATWCHSFLFMGETVWFPVVSVAVISIVLYKAWTLIGSVTDLLPTVENLERLGGDVCTVALCFLAGWLIYAYARYRLRRWGEAAPLKSKEKPFAPPTESSPTTSMGKSPGGQSLDSLVCGDMSPHRLDESTSVTDERVASEIAPRGDCNADRLFLIGEFTVSLADQVCNCRDTGGYLVIEGDFVIGGKWIRRERRPL